MKTIEEIKNEVAKNLGFDPDYDAELMIDECMQEYAKQCCDQQIVACAENSKLKPVPNCTYKGILKIIDQDSILNTPNVVTKK